ncbi:cyclopropane-fatty-acyl-phospholipid synthase family protein [Cobetia sp. QF-1]|uniref:SAM-dependent methyltransferase n=1 Tax=Cobetia sp. QF-1 TaxID=1969833 RepID=UPI000B544140|nr:class I SAM-dependent methyltransferase [Cobetia sp. QF-1]
MSHERPENEMTENYREDEPGGSTSRHLKMACDQVSHYASTSRHAALNSALEALLSAYPPSEVPVTALAGLDQLHLGGVGDTHELLALAKLQKPSSFTPLKILEPGAGLGGLARHLVSQSARNGVQHHVTTLDLSDSLCQVAIALNRATGLSEHIRVLEGDACYPELHPALPGRRFDRVLSQHLLVHLSDKPGVLKQWHDCLEDDGYLILHEPVLSVQAQAFGERPELPVPWALTTRADQLATCEELHEAMANSGFEVDTHVELTDQVLAWQARRQQHARSSHQSDNAGDPLGSCDAQELSNAMLAARALTPELIFGPTFALMQRNIAQALEAGWLEVHLWRLRKRPAQHASGTGRPHL